MEVVKYGGFHDKFHRIKFVHDPKLLAVRGNISSRCSSHSEVNLEELIPLERGGFITM